MRIYIYSLSVLGLIGVINFGCRSEEELPPPPKNLPTQIIDNFTLTETTGEDVTWKLSAKRADIYENANEAVLFDVRVDFYEEGVYTSTLTALEGKVHLGTHEMAARGNVILNSRKDGATLKTETLNWNPAENKIYSDSDCVLERGPSVIRGRGFTATPGLDSFTTHALDADLREKDLRGLEEKKGETQKPAEPAKKKKRGKRSK